MEEKNLIQDTGLFVGQDGFEFSLDGSFEAISNIFRTIKEYREYASPNETTWYKYIHEIFHILGFNTKELAAPRLIALQEMGTSQAPKALVCIIGPKEDFNQIAFGLDWESYLFYAAKYHHTDWAILTNGLQFKVLNFSIDADMRKFFKCELDEIIKNGKTDSFFTLYKIFYLINKSNGNEASGKLPNGNIGKKGRIIVERHLIRKEFWSQLLARSKGKTQLFSKKGPGIENYLNIGGGKTGIYYSYNVTYEGARVELYIDNGDGNWNKAVFDTLLRNKTKIEESFGDVLLWERLEDNRASVIRFRLSNVGLLDKDKWPELQDQLIDAMIKLEKAFRPYIQKIN